MDIVQLPLIDEATRMQPSDPFRLWSIESIPRFWFWALPIVGSEFAHFMKSTVRLARATEMLSVLEMGRIGKRLLDMGQ